MLSTAEAEYMALSGGANDLIALKELTSFFAGSVNGTVKSGKILGCRVTLRRNVP